MRKITANIIFPVSSAPLNDAYLVLNDKGLVIDIVNYNRNQEEVEGLEYYSGILVPGFVNAHCHLELSHLKSDIGEGLGLKHFVKQVQKIRNKPPEIIERSIDTALRYMWSRGINGLADVVNSSVGLEQKKKSQIQIYNFIELFNESGKATDEILNYGNYIYTALTEANQVASFVPHSMYATNRELLKGICGLTLNDDIATMHFLESHWESNLVVDKIIGYLKGLKCFEKILLVHNLNLNQEILEQIRMDKDLFEKLFWVVCPNSNQYINRELPTVLEFYKERLNICFGTDSLASNHQLSILDEMKTIAINFSDLPFDSILEWATINGAKALGMDNNLGSFEKGKQPGVLLIEGFDFKKNQLTQSSEVIRLV